MSTNFNTHHDDEPTPDGVDAGLTDALSTGEVEFVAEEQGRKGTGSLLLFGFVVVAASATYFMYWKTGPSTARAATNAESVEANTTIKKFLTDGQVSLKTMEEMRRNTEKVVARFQAYPSMTQVPLSALKGNPFRMLPATPTADATEAAARRKREQEREATVKAVENLSLQSVIVSDKGSACMINRTLYTQGQQVDIFTIERIGANAVIVKANGFRFELQMAK